MSSETWAPVKGYEGLYEVSDLGNIKGVDRVISRNGHPMRVKGRMIRQQAMPNGYMSVNLKNSGDSKRHYVHRVVASSFLFNGANLPEVNHKDEDKKNNCVSNLEWVTRSQNLKHNNGAAKRVESRRKPVVVVDVGFFESLCAAAEAMGTRPTNVSRCCKHVKGQRRIKGHETMFLEEFMAPIVDPPTTTESESGEAE